MPANRIFHVTGAIGEKRGLRVNVLPDVAVISIKDTGVHIGLDRAEAIALARCLDLAVVHLDRVVSDIFLSDPPMRPLLDMGNDGIGPSYAR